MRFRDLVLDVEDPTLRRGQRPGDARLSLPRGWCCGGGLHNEPLRARQTPNPTP
jgi:hypothetical protein